MNVCFVALNAYPAVDPSVGGFPGGTEARAWLLARHLARRDDMHVSFVVRYPRRTPQEECESVKLITLTDRLCRVRETVWQHAERIPCFPWVHIRRWKPSLVWQIPLLAAFRPINMLPRDPLRGSNFFRRIETDVYCTFGVASPSATVIASARGTRQRSVLVLGADSDLDERYHPDSDYISPYGEKAHVCYFALVNADTIVAQTPWQQQALRERFGRESILIENPIDLKCWYPRKGTASGERPDGLPDRYVLWIGRADAFHKRPLLALDIARRCPDVNFVLVMNPRDPKIEAQVAVQRPDNVTLVRRVPFAEMPRVMRHAAVFLSTSAKEFEGFPNVFLQAAASGVPIASLEVGDAFLTAASCGLNAGGDINRLVEYVKAAYANPESTKESRARGLRYVAEHHRVEQQTEKLATALTELHGARAATKDDG